MRIGVQAVQYLIEEGRQLALKNYDDSFRDEFLNICYECEFLLNKLMRMQEDSMQRASFQNGADQGHDACKFVAKELKDRLNFLGLKIRKTLVQQIADAFLDINYPIRKLVECATSNSGKALKANRRTSLQCRVSRRFDQQHILHLLFVQRKPK